MPLSIHMQRRSVNRRPMQGRRARAGRRGIRVSAQELGCDILLHCLVAPRAAPSLRLARPGSLSLSCEASPPSPMKPLFFALLLCLAPVASGSQLRLDSISLPLYLHGSESDPRISIVPVPFVTFHADPEWNFSALNSFISSQLISLNRFSIQGNCVAQEGSGLAFTIRLPFHAVEHSN